MQSNGVSYNLVLKSQTSISIISLWLHRAPLSCVDFRGMPCTCRVQLITAQKDLGVPRILKSIEIIFCKAHEYFHELPFVLT